MGLQVTSDYVSHHGHVWMGCLQLAASQGAGRAGVPSSQPVGVGGEVNSSAWGLSMKDP